jgi:hypothetical protein
MATLRRFVAPAALLAVLGAGCTGDGSSVVSSGPPTSSQTATQTAPPSFTPGEFRYTNAGLVVTLKLQGSAGTMNVDNGSGFALGKPDLYVLDGLTGKHIDGKVLDAQAIADGATASFPVQFPPEVTPKSLGLVILLFGSDNYGALAPA